MSDTIVVNVTESDVIEVPTGASGPQGYSAYQVAVENGFVGTEQAWLASLVGATGATGPSGVVSVTAPIKNSGTSTAAQLSLDMSYLGSYDTTTQTIASTTTAYKLNVGTAYLSHNITLANSRATFGKAGVYNQTFSIQFTNTGTTDADATIWTRVNGVDAPHTSSIVTVPSKHGSVNGKTIAQVSFIGQFAANDYVEIWWHADATTVAIETIGAGTNPTTPVSPGVISLFQQIA